MRKGSTLSKDRYHKQFRRENMADAKKYVVREIATGDLILDYSIEGVDDLTVLTTDSFDYALKFKTRKAAMEWCPDGFEVVTLYKAKKEKKNA